MTKPVAKSQLARVIPLLIRGVAPTAAISFGLAPATTLSAPGDLDPGFGDLGRAGPIMDFAGLAWSAQQLGNGKTLIAGGTAFEECSGYSYFYCYYSHPVWHASNFLGQLSDTGVVDSTFVPAQLQDTEVRDTALLPDGSIIVAGLTLVANHRRLAVFKLSSSGELDQSFGDGGMFQLAGQGMDHEAVSVTVDADGRIVVAGPQDQPSELVVVRLQPDGTIDQSFGTAGVFTHSPNDYVESLTVIGAGSGYRVTTSNCSIIGLTSDGKLDSSFGTGGIVTLAGDPVVCTSLVAQPDGRLLAAGATTAHSFAVRLLATGIVDPTFSSSAIEAGLGAATAMAVAQDATGSIVVAGTDPAGTPAPVVMRLQASGALDTTFGRGGTTLIDLPSDGAGPQVNDLLLRADGGVIAAGGDYWSGRPFLVRLLGAAGGGVPGVLGASQPSVSTNEQSPEVIVKVRRTGGAAGIVSVAYQTQAVDATYATPATPNLDYTDVSGRLTWNDGDTSEQEIHVPIKADNVTEVTEYFNVKLSDPLGGAGLGTRLAGADIGADGSPYGQFSILVDRAPVYEGTAVQVWVNRDYYSEGPVSVTVTPTAGTASAGADFNDTPVTVSWSDGETRQKTVMIAIPDDAMQEPRESFTVTLSNPTGGALIGPNATATVTVTDQPTPPSGGGGGGGGGSVGLMSLLMLGTARILQFAWPRRRRAGR